MPIDPESEDLLALAVTLREVAHGRRAEPGPREDPMAPTAPSPSSSRTREDLCPGVLRPWPAEDGALARVRLVGGRVGATALRALSRVAAAYGDGEVHLTARANLQLRGLPLREGVLPEEVTCAIEATGLLPRRSHDLVRNVMVSPLTGLRGGRADLRPVAADLDALLLGGADLAALPGRFCFVLDDGRGDLVDRAPDLGLVAVDDATAQLRLGSHTWGELLPLAQAPAALVSLARGFLTARGGGPTAPWHVDELPAPLAEGRPRDPRTEVVAPPLPYDDTHVAAPGGVLDAALVEALAARSSDLVVTPWRGVVVTEELR